LETYRVPGVDPSLRLEDAAPLGVAPPAVDLGAGAGWSRVDAGRERVARPRPHDARVRLAHAREELGLAGGGCDLAEARHDGESGDRDRLQSQHGFGLWE